MKTASAQKKADTERAGENDSRLAETFRAKNGRLGLDFWVQDGESDQSRKILQIQKNGTQFASKKKID